MSYRLTFSVQKSSWLSTWEETHVWDTNQKSFWDEHIKDADSYITCWKRISQHSSSVTTYLGPNPVGPIKSLFWSSAIFKSLDQCLSIADDEAFQSTLIAELSKIAIKLYDALRLTYGFNYGSWFYLSDLKLRYQMLDNDAMLARLQNIGDAGFRKQYLQITQGLVSTKLKGEHDKDRLLLNGLVTGIAECNIGQEWYWNEHDGSNLFALCQASPGSLKHKLVYKDWFWKAMRRCNLTFKMDFWVSPRFQEISWVSNVISQEHKEAVYSAQSKRNYFGRLITFFKAAIKRSFFLDYSATEIFDFFHHEDPRGEILAFLYVVFLKKYEDEALINKLLTERLPSGNTLITYMFDTISSYQYDFKICPIGYGGALPHISLYLISTQIFDYLLRHNFESHLPSHIMAFILGRYTYVRSLQDNLKKVFELEAFWTKLFSNAPTDWCMDNKISQFPSSTPKFIEHAIERKDFWVYIMKEGHLPVLLRHAGAAQSLLLRAALQQTALPDRMESEVFSTEMHRILSPELSEELEAAMAVFRSVTEFAAETELDDSGHDTETNHTAEQTGEISDGCSYEAELRGDDKSALSITTERDAASRSARREMAIHEVTQATRQRQTAIQKLAKTSRCGIL